ncbi:MAG TPA: hypothetical protein VHE14_00730 [Solirubrobacteraceae bacterium]|nr:hypothetical protein [Solirubrobacteraceae bacterium]
MRLPTREQLMERLSALPSGASLVSALDGVRGVHMVGGAVRDLLLGIERPLDLDLVVEGDAEPIGRLLVERLEGELRSHERFGTVTVVAGGERIDLVTARRERYAAPGALPEVEPGTLEQDLRRRDFSVHAIALALEPGERLGELSHVPEALDDLAAGKLRVLHAGSFLDDPTRLLRLARYGARLGFEPDAQTAALANEAIAARALATVSGARVGDELRLLLDEPSVVDGLERCEALGLLAALDDALRFDRAPVERALSLTPPDGRRGLVALAAVAQSVPAERLRAWIDRLEFEAPERDRVIAAATLPMGLSESMRASSSRSALAALLAPIPVEAVAIAGALGADDAARLWIDELRHVALEIDGDDLLAAGIAEGPEVGRALAAALARKLDGEAVGREQELRAALAAARG